MYWVVFFFLESLVIVSFVFLQLDNKKDDKDKVVLYFQDMLEVVVSDIMEDNSVLETGGGSTDGGASVELFASEGALNFPIEPQTEAWKEKVFVCAT